MIRASTVPKVGDHILNKRLKKLMKVHVLMALENERLNRVKLKLCG
jgi:hypothetical protein